MSNIYLKNDHTRGRTLTVKWNAQPTVYSVELMPGEEVNIWYTEQEEGFTRGSMYAAIYMGDGYIELDFHSSCKDAPEILLQRDRAARMVK